MIDSKQEVLNFALKKIFGEDFNQEEANDEEVIRDDGSDSETESENFKDVSC